MKEFNIFPIILVTIFCFVIVFTNPGLSKNVSVIDGDTFKIKQEYFRLSSVDTPEKGERYYHKAKIEMGNWLVENNIKTAKDVIKAGCLEKAEKGYYGRTIIYCPELERRLIKKGLIK